MAVVPPLPLTDIVDITVTIAPSAASANAFNQGLIIGPSAVIPGSERLRVYASTSDMISDGWTSTMPEFIAAQIYFSQQPPAGDVWIGTQVADAIGSVIPNSANRGTGYVVGDQVGVTQSGGNGGVVTVLTVAAGGTVTTVAPAVGQGGSGYVVGTGLATTGGTGTGLKVDITGVGESLLQAAQACRVMGSAWYGLMVVNPAQQDNLDLSTWADAIWQTTRYYPWSSDSAIPAGTAGNLFLQLQAQKLRVMPTYATTQNTLYPNNVYAAAGVMGVEMGLNTGLAGSFFTVAHKQIAGIAPEPLTETQFGRIKAAGGNAYCNYAPFSLYEPGLMSNASPSYLWLFLAMLVNNLQIGEMNVLTSMPAVPQTNAGEHQLVQAANDACEYMAEIGFLAPGNWSGKDFSIPGVQVLNKQALNLGYLNLAQSYTQQSAADRAAGKAMPIYCFVITAGATLSLVIGVYTQL